MADPPDQTPILITLACQQSNHFIHVQMSMEVHDHLLSTHNKQLS